ncbi:MAG: ABC transporter substrate-binding protein [Methanoregula sp.]|nr:ABC transporter substrate-binding protein [Methanoregula sp.]
MDNKADTSVSINPDMPVGEIMRKYRGAKHLFRTYGFDRLVDTAVNSLDAPTPSLREVLAERNIDCNGFVALLIEQIEAHLASAQETLASRRYNQENLQFLALLPCPVKIPFHSAFSEFLGREWNGAPPFSYLVESNANNQLAYYQHIGGFRTPADMPDIVISPGLNGYYHRYFVENFKKKNYFSDVMDPAGSPYKNLDLRDPDGHYSVIGANIEVMVIDNDRMGDRNMPERWSDLIRPEYRDAVTIRGQDGFFCETVLLTLYKEIGLSGVRDFARSVGADGHPAQMVKNAGSPKSRAPPISIMPLFFANIAKSTKNVTIVWPQDGAIVSPVTLIAKRERQEALEPLVSFLAKEKTGAIFSGASFPSMAAGVEPCVPRDATFDWVGWDYLNSHDVGREIDCISREFSEVYYAKAGKKP